MPTKRKQPSDNPSRLQDADRVIRSYEETPEAPSDDVGQAFADAAEVSTAGREMRRRIEQTGRDAIERHGGDIDAGLDPDSAEEEAVGGSNPTPDQDIVDDLGRGAGLTYQDDEPISVEKIEGRDRDRWELNPASSEDYEERTREGKSKK
jgi:hypothetical protein